ncbi:MAG: response regulator [Chitinivibrionales bacterium]
MKKILLVDDNHDTLDLLEVYLYKEYDIYTALNGFEGLNIAREQIPDCILTDIMMPVMDGIQFFNHLRRDEATVHIPVIALTSFVKKANTKSLENIGFNDVVTKPLDRDRILDAVHKIFENRTVAE